MKKIKGLRWWIVSLVFLATFINYIDRNALSVMWPGISKDLGMTKEDYALILTFFMVAYAIGQSAFGKIFDALGTRISFLLSMLIWSISIGLHSIARSEIVFGIFRFTLGFGEAGNWPGATKSNAQWFPVSERAIGQGIFNSGASIGAIVSAPIVAYSYTIFGWQTTFLFISALSLLWLIPWLIFFKSPPADHPWITEEEKEYILKDQNSKDEVKNKAGVLASWKELLTYKESWAVIVSRFFVDPIWWLFVSWLPIYLSETFNFDVAQIGLFAWVPYVGAAFGSIIGGFAAGLFMNMGWSMNKARKATILIGGIIMLPSLILTAYASTPLLAVLLIALILFGFQFSIGNIQTLPSDYFTEDKVGSLAGLSGTSAIVGTLITTWLVPVITQASYWPFFMLGAVFVPFGIIPVFILGGEVKPVREKYP